MSQNEENGQNVSNPTTPNSSFADPGPSCVSTPVSSTPSLVSTPPNSAGGSTPSSVSSAELNDEESNLEEWICSVAGMT